MTSDLVQRVAAAWEAWPPSLIARGLVVGVSGGVDSMVLLELLTGLARARDIRLIVAHAHHGLRAQAADGDATMVGRAARRLGWNCVTARLNVRGEQERTAESVEMSARRLRHAFLARVARDAGARAVALAHHADDQVELFLLRLFRGSGGDGLGGMAEIGPSPADACVVLVRPLLGVAKVELLREAKERGIEYREDASNLDLSIPRNQLRQRILPWLRNEVGAHLDRTVLRSAELVGADAACVESLAESWAAAKRRRPFGRLSIAVQRAVIRRQLWELNVPVEFELVERLRLSEAGQSVPAGRRVWRNPQGTIAEVTATGGFRPESTPLQLSDRGGITFAGVKLSWQRSVHAAKRTAAPRKYQEQFDARAVGRDIVLRHWQPGDRFRPLGMSQATKLQDLFSNRKVPAPLRRSRVVAATAQGEIFWVEGLPPGERFKISNSTSPRLVWRWQRSGGKLKASATRGPAPAD